MWSFSEGKQAKQGSGKEEVGGNMPEVENQETLEDNWNKGWDISARGLEGELAMDRGNTETIYTHTHQHQVKVIRAETDNQGRGRNPQVGGGGSGTRGEVNAQD